MVKVYTEKRKWGWFERFVHDEKATVKILTILPKKRFSLQYHNHRQEFWKFLDNPAKVTVGKKHFRVKKGDSVSVPKKTLHRIEALNKPVRVLEIASGKFDEKDIVRIQDDYGRA